MVSRIVRCAALGSCLSLLAGCYLVAPIHVWQPPELESTVGKRVVLQSVGGPPETAADVKAKVLEMVPRDTGRNTSIVRSEDLLQGSHVRLASATDEGPSDVALAAVARQHGIEYLLRGRVLTQQTDSKDKSNEANKPDKVQPQPQPKPSEQDNPRLAVSWRLMSLGENPGAKGQPVAVDVKSAVKRYPDLAMVGDPDQILTSAAARETFSLITPSVDRQQVQLAVPYVMFGSGEVRRGNVAALNGQWGEAEQIWNDVLARHPMQAAAAHNLALAAAAGQDFSRAKRLARQAIRLQPTPLHERTLVWIELRQRDYHKSFNLPDPAEGWLVTH